MKANLSRILTLAELDQFDPQAPAGKAERRFWCPLCGEGKPRDAAHRCLCVNVATGLWNCKRCGEKGLLGEFRQPSTVQAPSQARRERSANALSRAFSVQVTSEAVSSPAGTVSDTTAPPNTIEGPASPVPERWRVIYEAAQPVVATAGVATAGVVDAGATSAGAAYLERRSIPLIVAERAGVRFVDQWHRRPALVFPFREQGGAVVAIAGRCLQSGGMDKPAAGPKKQGAFFAPTEKFTPLDSDVPAIILCEAPMDALSLATAGFPALALGGTTPPVWLARACAFRRVALAFDADMAGDAATQKIGGVLLGFGVSCQRLRPQGAKDWNEYLQLFGPQRLSDTLALDLFLTA